MSKERWHRWLELDRRGTQLFRDSDGPVRRDLFGEDLAHECYRRIINHCARIGDGPGALLTLWSEVHYQQTGELHNIR